MPIYIYKGNSQISTNAIRNNKAVKAIYAKEQGKDAVCVWGIDTSIPCDQMFTYSITDNKVTITGLKPEVKTAYITIPNIISNQSVSSISGLAFRNKTKILSTIISDSVTNIGEGAFSGCSSLESITIPFVGAKAGVTSSDTYQYPFGYIFGTSSYDGGVATTQYYYGNSTSSMTSTTYYIPLSLKSVTVAGGNILSGAFYNCTGLTSVTIGNGVTNIGNGAFNTCSNLTNITIGNDIINIGMSAFFGCKKLTSVVIPDSVTSIGNAAFYNCSGLTSITIGNSVTSIGEDTFRNCRGLTSITFNGTTTQWNAISKGNEWNYNTGNYTIHCTDGDIPKS